MWLDLENIDLDATKELYLTVFREGKTFWGKVKNTRYNQASNSVVYILAARDFQRMERLLWLESWSMFYDDKKLKWGLKESVDFEEVKKERTGDPGLENRRGSTARN